MSRKPTYPRYYPSRQGYYVQVNGKQILLAKGAGLDENVRNLALQKFREIVPATPRTILILTEEESSQIRRAARRFDRQTLRRWYKTHCQGYPLPNCFEFAFEFLEKTGCKPSELCRINCEDVDHSINWMQIGKRTVNVNQPCGNIREDFDREAFDVLRRMHNRIGNRHHPWSGPLFRNRKGRGMTVDCLHHAFCRFRDAQGLRKELTPMALRHTYAVKFLRGGGKYPELAEVLGISEIQCRRLYQQFLQ